MENFKMDFGEVNTRASENIGKKDILALTEMAKEKLYEWQELLLSELFETDEDFIKACNADQRRRGLNVSVWFDYDEGGLSGGVDLNEGYYDKFYFEEEEDFPEGMEDIMKKYKSVYFTVDRELSYVTEDDFYEEEDFNSFTSVDELCA